MNDAPKPVRSRAARIFVNALSGAGARVATMAVGFLLTPFIISELGLSQYGLWAILGSLAGYLGLLDFGLGGAFVKFISEYVELKDKSAARQVVMFGMLFYAGFGLLLAAPIFTVAPLIVHAFKMPADQYASAASFLRAVFCLVVVAMISNVPGMVVVSMQRMDLASRNGLVAYFAYAGVTLVFLKLHYGITAVLIGQAAQIVIGGTVQLVTAYRLFGSVWHNPLRIEPAIVKRMVVFGGWTQLGTIFNIVNLDVGRFIAAGLVGITSVGLYEIAGKLAFFAKTFPTFFLNALLPAAAGADARSDDRSIARMYAVGTRLSVFSTFGCIGFFIAAADPIVRVWLGRPYPLVAELVFWLGLGYAANSLAGVGSTILRASGKPRFETYYTAVAMVINVGTTMVLTRTFGIVGVAMGTAAGWFAGTVYFLCVYHRLNPSPWWSSIGSPVLRMAVADVLAAWALFAAVHVPAVMRCFEGRALGLIVLATSAALYAAVFTGASIASGAWRHDDAELVSRMTTTLRARFARKSEASLYGTRV